MSVLRADRLVKSFDGFRAVDGASFAVPAGYLVALIGPNGAGKTTCFNMLMGQLTPDRGRVFLGEENVTGFSPRQMSRRGVGRTFQVTQTFASMSVRENVQTALLAHHRRFLPCWRRASTYYADGAAALLRRVGMAEQAERPCAILAYGDLKRVELAIALASDPRLLLMDEPTAGMAPKERVALMALTAEIVRERGISVLFTEHDMDVVFAHADVVIVLNRGRVIAVGRPGEVREDPQVREVYLGSGAMFGH
jgi:branched-chain amino acid transport system ATP-binding protein